MNETSTNAIATVTNKEIANTTEFEMKKKLYNAITSADNKMSDFINKVIKVKNILFTEGQITDQETGEVRTSERAIVFDDEGKTYHTMSSGLLNSLHSLVAVFGDCNAWAEPIAVTVTRKETKNGQTFLLEIM